MKEFFRLAVAALFATIVQAQLPPGCAPFPNNCLYTPGATFEVRGAAASVSYRDVTANTRTLELYVRTPVGPAGPLPVVIWSPGADVTAEVKDTMAAWSEATAKAGYLTVTVRHPKRDLAQGAEMCAAVGLDAAICAGLNPANWDWPNDLKEVISWLERINDSGPSETRGRIDLARIAVAGHDDGGNAAMSLAGARRLLTTQDRKKANDFTDPRPVAFLSLSPQGPTQEGFFDTEEFQPTTSWMAIKRPVFTATGAGDNNCQGAVCGKGDSPSRRRTVQELLPAGDKYMMYVDSVKISHGFVGSLDMDACVAAGVAAALCSNFDDWLRSTAVAFLDAHVRGRSAAQSWLRNGLIRAASGNVVELDSK